MNFLPGRIERRDGEVRVRLGGEDGAADLPVRNPDAFRGLDSDRAVTVGIRPHDVHPVSDPTEADLVLETALVETLGPNVNVHGHVASTPFIATLEGTEGPARGERLGLRVQDLHLFDGDTEASLRE